MGAFFVSYRDRLVVTAVFCGEISTHRVILKVLRPKGVGGVVKVKYTELVKFLSLKEQIKDLESQAKEISERIKSEFGEHGGESEIGGIAISCKRVVTTQINKESLAEDIGVERLSKHQYQSVSIRLEVKPKSDAVKSRLVKRAL